MNDTGDSILHQRLAEVQEAAYLILIHLRAVVPL